MWPKIWKYATSHWPCLYNSLIDVPDCTRVSANIVEVFICPAADLYDIFWLLARASGSSWFLSKHNRTAPPWSRGTHIPLLRYPDSACGYPYSSMLPCQARWKSGNVFPLGYGKYFRDGIQLVFLFWINHPKSIRILDLIIVAQTLLLFVQRTTLCNRSATLIWA